MDPTPEKDEQEAATGSVVLGHFRLVGELGRGGMGVVHEAWDETLHRRVALKVLPEEIARDKGRRERFLREARAAAALSHRAIATVFQIEEREGRLGIVMELVPGTSLRRVLGRGALPLSEAMRVAREIAAALAAAHRAGIAHRDLKPENVMVSEDAVKLLDFGIAKALGANTDDGAATGLTATGQVVGTAGYMAPEQASGERIDQRADVFAFGVLLFEMIAGVLPFDGPTAIARVVAVTRDPPSDLAALAPDAPRALVDLVNRCLAKAPADRPHDGAALVTALEPIEVPTSGERSRGPRVVTSVGTDPEAVTEAAAARAPVTGSGRPAPARTGLVDRHTDLDPGRRPSRSTVAVVAIGVVVSVALVAFLASNRPEPPPWARGGVASTVTSATAVTSVTSVTSGSASPARSAGEPPSASPLTAPCAFGEGDRPRDSNCEEGRSAWCDTEWRPVACCGKGLVPIDADGACGCPPGGSLKMDGPIPGCPPGDTDSLVDRQDLQARIMAEHPRLVACYEKDLKDNPNLGGRLDLAIRLAPDGRVFSARIAQSSLPANSAQSCVLRLVRGIRFAPPRGAHGYSLKYPVEFGPGDDPSPAASAR